MPHMVSLSVLSLYEVIGYPCPEVPNPLSQDKFNASYTYHRQCVGRIINTRKMTVGMVPAKRQALIVMLEKFLSFKRLTLMVAAELHGTLENHTRHVSWTRPWFYTLQNAM